MKIITTLNQADYYIWHAKALMDDGVWPFLSMRPRYCPGKIQDDDWAQRVIMDDAGNGCCTLDFDRNGDHSATVCIWVLSVEMRAVVAAALLRDAILLGRRYDIAWIDTGCHESNEASRKLHEKLCGAPWGIQPFGAWNGRLQKYESKFCFRVGVGALAERLGAA